LKTGVWVVADQLSRVKEQYAMKYLKIVFGLAAVAGLMAVVAPAAMANPRWVTCKANAGKGNFEDSLCSKAKVNGGWETAEIAESVEVTASSPTGLTLEDSKATGGATAINCTGSGLGKAAPGGRGEIVRITATGCKFVPGKVGSCEESKAVTAKPVNLPWSYELFLRLSLRTGISRVRAEIVSLISGKSPGWAVECTVGGIFKITDTCEGVTTTSVEANRAAKIVETEFEEESEETPGTCSVGGAKAGRVAGNIINRLRTGAPWWVLPPI
jgi:hypothetical protein